MTSAPIVDPVPGLPDMVFVTDSGLVVDGRALGVLDDRTIAYLPRAFAPDSRTLLQERFPDAIIADEADTEWLGLNLVSDGRNVVLAAQAGGLAERLRDRGFVPVPVDFSEFRKAGGGIKCATLELRGVERQAKAHGS